MRWRCKGKVAEPERNPEAIYTRLEHKVQGGESLLITAFFSESWSLRRLFQAYIYHTEICQTLFSVWQFREMFLFEILHSNKQWKIWLTGCCQGRKSLVEFTEKAFASSVIWNPSVHRCMQTLIISGGLQSTKTFQLLHVMKIQYSCIQVVWLMLWQWQDMRLGKVKVNI